MGHQPSYAQGCNELGYYQGKPAQPDLAALKGALGMPARPHLAEVSRPPVRTGAAAAEMPRRCDDVVVQARQSWLSSPCPATAPPGSLNTVSKPVAHIRRQLPQDVELDPVSGLEIREMPGLIPEAEPSHMSPMLLRPQAEQQQQQLRSSSGSGGAKLETPAGDAELVVSAPEFHEEFGTLPEHTEDPLTGVTLPAADAHAAGAGLPRWLERHRPRSAQRPHQALPLDRLSEARSRLVEERNFAVVESVFDEIDQFEKMNLASQGADAMVLDSDDDDMNDRRAGG